jgi:methylthioribulose-1-phosphate dehydratase
MLKGLSGVRSHDHREDIPILANSQDYAGLTAEVERTLDRHPGAHGFLLHRHGLYTWGRDLQEAKRHVEILEFLFEVRGRQGGARPHPAGGSQPREETWSW